MLPSHCRRLALRPFTLLACGFLAVGCSAEQGGGGGFTPPPMPVETAVAHPRQVADRFEAVGTIEAGDAITVVAEIDGTIVSLPFSEGARITRGGLIARLDDDQLAAEVQRAEALRDQAHSTWERVKSVVDQGAGTPQDLDDAGAAMKVAEANLSLAQIRLGKTRITAPFAGMIGARRVSPGAFVRAGQKVTDLARIDELRIAFAAPERMIGKLRRGAEVAVTTTAFPGDTLQGRIEVIEPTLDSATRSARIIARVDNRDERFRPGMSAGVSTVFSRRDNALTVPSEAVFVEGNQAFVYVVNADSTVARAPLTLGTRLADVVEVLGGITPGTRVVRAGHQKLFPGARVMPVTSQPDGGEAIPEGEPGADR